MTGNKTYTLISALIFCLAAALRLPQLSDRPMHTDEAVHGMKLIEMMQGEYRYDPTEYHGPALNVFTLIAGKNPASVSESTLRRVPVIFSLMTLLLILNMRSVLGVQAALISGLLFSVSPVFVYYSRYYIQESLLIFFTTGLLFSGFRWLKTPSVKWSLAAGFFMGCMHATKETWLLNLAAMVLSLILLRFVFRYRILIPGRHLLWAVLAMMLTSALFYSNGFTYFRGIMDSWRTYAIYLHRGAGNSVHVYPWTQYFQWLFFQKLDSRFPLTEIAIIPAAVPVFVYGMRKLSGTARFILFYTVILTVIYCMLPYKTPWSLLSFWQGWLLLAGMGWTIASQTIRTKRIRIPFLFLSALLLLHLTMQSYAATHRYESAPSNPWTYAHPQDDIAVIDRTIRDVAGRHPDHNHLFIQICYPDHGYWPLPWTFRDFTNISWTDQIPADTVSAPVILISPVLEPDLVRKLYELPPPGLRDLYIPLFDEALSLRPGVPIHGYIQKQTWDQLDGA